MNTENLIGRRKYEVVYAKSNGVCYLCGLSIEEDFKRLMEWYDMKSRQEKIGALKMPFKRRSIPLNFDHVVPKSLDKGKETSPLRSIENLMLVHKKCNGLKANKILL